MCEIKRNAGPASNPARIRRRFFRSPWYIIVRVRNGHCWQVGALFVLYRQHQTTILFAFPLTRFLSALYFRHHREDSKQPQRRPSSSNYAENVPQSKTVFHVVQTREAFPRSKWFACTSKSLPGSQKNEPAQRTGCINESM